MYATITTIYKREYEYEYKSGNEQEEKNKEILHRPCGTGCNPTTVRIWSIDDIYSLYPERHRKRIRKLNVYNINKE